MRKFFIPPLLVIYSSILMVVLFFLFPQFNLIPFYYNLTGVLIAVSGFMIMKKIRTMFKKHKTNLKIENPKAFIKEGLFSKTRNPMYLGMFLFLLGLSIFSTNVISLFLPFIFLVIVRYMFIAVEEKLMLETFGDEYSDYKKSVRRWL